MALAPAFLYVVVAAFCLLMILASYVLGNILAKALSGIPFGVGSWIASEVAGAMQDAIKFFENILSEATVDMGWLLSAISNQVWRLINEIDNAMYHSISTGLRAVDGVASLAAQVPVEVAAGLKTAEDYATDLYHDAVNVTYAVESSVLAAALADANTVLGDAENLYNKAVNGAAAALAGAETVLGGEIAAVADRVSALEGLLLGDVGQLVNTIESNLALAIATAEQDAAAALQEAAQAAQTIASSAAGAAVSALEQAGHDLVAGPWEALLTQLAPLVQALPGDLANALNLPQILAEDIPVSIPGILAMVVPAIAAVTAEVEDCLVPNCSNLNALSGLLNGMWDAAFLAALFAFLGSAAADPSGAAGDINSTVGGVASDIANGFMSLIGIA